MTIKSRKMIKSKIKSKIEAVEAISVGGPGERGLPSRRGPTLTLYLALSHLLNLSLYLNLSLFAAESRTAF
jgi:hypothetical protein